MLLARHDKREPSQIANIPHSSLEVGLRHTLTTQPIWQGGPMRIFRIKTSTPEEYCTSGLKRCLSAFDLTLLGMGCIIGAGIFVITGKAAATLAGPGIVLSFVVAGFACAFAALCYAELAASVGGCGSAYGYAYASLGELMAWVIGWMLVLEYGVAASAVANGWSGYFNDALTAVGWGLPDALTHGPWQGEGGVINLPAATIIIILASLLIIGAKQSSQFNTALVFVKLLTIAVFIGVAIFHVKTELWHPFLPFGWFGTGADGNPTGVLAGAASIFFAYIGFDAVSTAAEEAKDIQRDVPIGIIASLAICTVLYIIVSGLLTGIVPYTELNVSSPVAHALQLIGLNWASALVATGVITGLTTVMLVLYYGLTRVLFAMSRDGLLPVFFGQVNSKTHTPVRVIVLCGLLIAGLAGFVPLKELSELVNIGTLGAFVVVCIGVIVLRSKHPDMKRPFKTPWYPLLPILGVLSCTLLMANLPLVTWQRFGLWLIAGLVIYFSYSIHHSKLGKTV